MPRETFRTTLDGDVTERAELLNGAMQLALDGAATPEAGGWQATLSLAWRLGRAGQVALDEGDLSLERDGSELVALLEEGTVELDPDTGAAIVDALFTIEDASGLELNGDGLHGRFEIDAERWRGELEATPPVG